jgi:hypothetical protein
MGIGRLGGMAVGLGIGAVVVATAGVASADDMQVSIDGMDLFPTAGNTATATSGMGDMAIAIGAGSSASALGGIGDSAFADGANSLAQIGSDGAANFDSATAEGTGSGASVFFGMGDSAFADGTDSFSVAEGSLDSATVFGPNSTAFAGEGNGDLASIVNTGSTADAADAGGINATDLGNNDIASVLGTGSTATAGADLTTPGDFDLATVFGDLLNAVATGGNFLVDILPSL